MKTNLILLGLSSFIIGCNTAQRDDKVSGDTDEKSEADSKS